MRGWEALLNFEAKRFGLGFKEPPDFSGKSPLTGAQPGAQHPLSWVPF